MQTRPVPEEHGPSGQVLSGSRGWGVRGACDRHPRRRPRSQQTKAVASGGGGGVPAAERVSREPRAGNRGERGETSCARPFLGTLRPTRVLLRSAASKSRAGTGWDKRLWNILAYWESLMVGERRKGAERPGAKVGVGRSGDGGPGLLGVSEETAPLTRLHPFEKVLKGSLGLGALAGCECRDCKGGPAAGLRRPTAAKKSAADAPGSALKPQEAWGRRRDKSTQTFLPPPHPQRPNPGRLSATPAPTPRLAQPARLLRRRGLRRCSPRAV